MQNESFNLLALQLIQQTPVIKALQTDTTQIAALALEKEAENDAFRSFIRNSDGTRVDQLVQEINAVVEPAIDCTKCGACCKFLMINVTHEEAGSMANHLQIPLISFKRKYIEESLLGHLVVNRMPCHFLAGSQCTQYEHRFNECREFPHLTRQNFKDRMFGTLIHYAMCPIIFNVIEELKLRCGFKTPENAGEMENSFVTTIKSSH